MANFVPAFIRSIIPRRAAPAPTPSAPPLPGVRGTLSPAAALLPAVPERRLLETTVGHKAGHVARRRDVEGGIERGGRRGRDGPPRDGLHFLRAALLDRYAVAVAERAIDRRRGSRAVERHAVMQREHGERIGADLVGEVAIR